MLGLRTTGDIAIHYNVPSTSTESTFTFSPYFIAASCIDVRSLAIADLDNDGSLDIVAACISAGNVGYYLSVSA